MNFARRSLVASVVLAFGCSAAPGMGSVETEGCIGGSGGTRCGAGTDDGTTQDLASSTEEGSDQDDSEVGSADGNGGADCDLDAAQLDRSAQGYPAGPYGALVGDRFAPGAGLVDCDENPVDFVPFLNRCNRALVVSIDDGRFIDHGQNDRVALYNEYLEGGVELVHILVSDYDGQPPWPEFCEAWTTGSWPGDDWQFGEEVPFPTFMDPSLRWSSEYVPGPGQTPIVFVLDANANVRFKSVGNGFPTEALRAALDLVRQSPYEP
ncbi:MAG: hypothetical protein AAF721_16095 [Myxococcota bacterium]